MAKKYSSEYPLTELHRSGYEVADGFPDIRGWKIVNATGQRIGEVVELIFDPLSKSVRYLVVHIDGKPLHLVSRDVIIPIGLAELIEESGVVLVENVTLGHLAELPTYKRGELGRNFENSVRKVFVPATATTTEEEPYDEVYYNHDHFNQERFLHKRPSQTSERIIPKEKLASPGAGRGDYDDRKNAFSPFREGAIELTEHAEVPVVSKEARIVEEVKVNKDVTEREETVRDKVRRTEVDVERLPDDEHR